MDLASARDDVLTRLGDVAQQVWTVTEVDLHLLTAYRQLAHLTRIFWDQTYLENLPRGFSYTQAWEAEYATFDYGCANFTSEFERDHIEDEDEQDGPGTHTSPFEATDGFLSDASIPATSELPKTVTEIERAYWDHATIDALNPRQLSAEDSRYQTTEGEVYGYTWRQDGIRTFRKVRVPAAQCASYTVDGSWGILRVPTDISADTVTGTWGIPRRIPGQHPIGSEMWGLPRRCYQDGTNVRVEHWREGRAVSFGTDTFELPDRYAKYLRDYALARCLGRTGPGQDLKLAQHFDQRWQRDLARVKRRMRVLDKARVGRLGEARSSLGQRPPRPRLPWQYGSTVRP